MAIFCNFCSHKSTSFDHNFTSIKQIALELVNQFIIYIPKTSNSVRYECPREDFSIHTTIFI